MKKTILLVTLQLCFCIGYAQTFTVDNIVYKVTSVSDEVKIQDSPNATGNIVIPSKVENDGFFYSVISIGVEAFYVNQLESVTIPNSVISIGQYAFSSNQLKSVTIPNSVTSIGKSAFSDNQLTSVTLTNSVTSLEDYAFAYNQLKSITMPNSVTSIGEGTFFYNNLENIIIPKNVTTIGKNAFRTNELTNITISNSVTSIGNGAFRSNQLKNVVIPNSVTNIEDYAFQDNELMSITVENPAPVVINSNVFVDNDLLANITLNVPSGSEELYKSAKVWKEFNIKTITSTSSIELTNKVTIYPNPISDLVNVSVEGIENGSIKVLKSTGAFVQNEVISNGTAQFNVNGKAGLYFIEVTSDNKTAIFKVMKN